MDRRGPGSSVSSCPSPARRQVFPACAIEALEQVTKICGQQTQKWRGPAGATAVRNNELQHLLDNDLFFVSARRRDLKLNPNQQFQLLAMLCEYFNERSSEPRGHQYYYFEVIFCGREGEGLLHDIRISVLMNLCSLSIQYPCYSLLNHVSQWLHKIGSGKSYAQQIINLLVDHFIMSPSDWNLHEHLLPLADEVPEFVSYFVAYSVTKTTIRTALIDVLAHWLTGAQSNRIITFIKETPTITKYFANNTFWLLVLYDCTSSFGSKSVLHGITTMLYADWVKTPPLNIKSALEVLTTQGTETKFNAQILYYHLHFARLSNCLSKKDLNEFLEHTSLEEKYRAPLQSIK